jgi:hypothetical protein
MSDADDEHGELTIQRFVHDAMAAHAEPPQPEELRP